METCLNVTVYRKNEIKFSIGRNNQHDIKLFKVWNLCNCIKTNDYFFNQQNKIIYHQNITFYNYLRRHSCYT